MSGESTHFQLDRSGGSTLALCAHCSARLLRTTAADASAAVRQHLLQVHRIRTGR